MKPVPKQVQIPLLSCILVLLALAATLLPGCRAEPSPTPAPPPTAKATTPAVAVTTKPPLPLTTPAPTPKPTAKPTPATTPAPKVEPAAPYRVGFLSTQTGYMAGMGAGQVTGVMAAVEEINAKGGINGHQLQVVTYDDASDESQAVLLAKKLAQEDQVLSIFGATYVGAMMAVLPVASENEIPFVANGATVAADTPVKKWMFRISSGEPDMIAPVLEYFQKKKVSKIAVLYQGAAYGQANWRVIQPMAGRYGLTIVTGESYSPTGTDFAPQLSKIQASGAQGLFIIGSEMAGGLAIKQAVDMGIKFPILALPGLGLPDIVKAVQKQMEAPNFAMLNMSTVVWQQLPDSDPIKAPNAEVDGVIRKKYNRPAHQFDALGYSLVQIMADALKRANPTGNAADLQADRAKVRDALEATRMTLPVGVYQMSPEKHAGYVLGSGAVLTVLRDGRWQLLRE